MAVQRDHSGGTAGPQWQYSGKQWETVAVSGSTVGYSGGTAPGPIPRVPTRVRTVSPHPHTRVPPTHYPGHHHHPCTTPHARLRGPARKNGENHEINAHGVLGKTTVCVYPALVDMPGLTVRESGQASPFARPTFLTRNDSFFCQNDTF